MKLDALPGDCFVHVLSYSSPGDAARTSLVSSAIRRAVDSDDVWENFLPSDWRQILSELVVPLPRYESKKELFLRLCNPHLIDGGKKVFFLEKSTGKKCYIMSARELSITWACNPLYWSWLTHSRSRFAEVAELRTICWLQIKGRIRTKMLSPRTSYVAYLIVKFARRAYGLDNLRSTVSVRFGSFKSQGGVYLRCPVRNKKRAVPRRSIGVPKEEDEDEENYPREREDGWVEIELGGFYNDRADSDNEEEEVIVSLEEVTGEHLKGGLIVEGIEIRPKNFGRSYLYHLAHDRTF